MKQLLIGLMAVIFMSCSGCSAFYNRPVAQSAAPVGSLLGIKLASIYSVTSERRQVIIVPEVKEKFRICAEPAPDTAENVASTLRALASAKYKGVDVSGELATSFAKSAVSLFTRSQGIQLFRDSSYTLCQAYMNGAINGNQYLEQYGILLNRAADLIKAELPTLALMKTVLGQQIQPPSPGQPEKKFSGKIESVNTGEKTIVVTSADGTKNTFVVDEKTTKITQDSTILSFPDLKKDMQVDVSYDKMEGNKATATAIKVSPPQEGSKVIKKISDKVKPLTK